jgi:hypothetical protein
MQHLMSVALVSVLFSSGSAVAKDHDCPGVLHAGSVNGGSETSGCCVGGTLPPVVVSSCPGWPLCTGPATTSQSYGPLSCATNIPYTASNYDELISSASKSLEASGTHIQTTLMDAFTLQIITSPTGTRSNAISIGSSGGSASASPSGGDSSSTTEQAMSTNGAVIFVKSFGGMGGALLGLIGIL